MIEEKIVGLVELAPDSAKYWLKEQREWPPEEPVPGYQWARLVLGDGAIEAVVKYLGKEFGDRVPLKFYFLQKKDDAKVEILVAHLDTYAALLLRQEPLEPVQLALLGVASGLEGAGSNGAERDRRRDLWKKRRVEAAEWAQHFLRPKQVEDLYTKGFI